VRQIAAEVARALGMPYIEPEITGRYRSGDIRHCFADIAKAERILGYRPQVSLEEGLAELAEWLEGQQATDRSAEAHAELAERGLTV
jgi:dTDP-L-rhamnose 4-epimerase